VEAPGAALGVVLDKVAVPDMAVKDAAAEADKAAVAEADKAKGVAVEADKAATSASRDSATVCANCAFPCFSVFVNFGFSLLLVARIEIVHEM
jgi:hypothetical protein